MSRWLKSVNNLLETLDTNVGDAVMEDDDDDDYDDNYERLLRDGDDGGVGGQSSVDDILAKRGLDDDDDDDDEYHDDDDENDENNNDNGNNDGKDGMEMEKEEGAAGDEDDDNINTNMDMNVEMDMEDDNEASVKAAKNKANANISPDANEAPHAIEYHQGGIMEKDDDEDEGEEKEQVHKNAHHADLDNVDGAIATDDANTKNKNMIQPTEDDACNNLDDNHNNNIGNHQDAKDSGNVAGPASTTTTTITTTNQEQTQTQSVLRLMEQQIAQLQQRLNEQTRLTNTAQSRTAAAEKETRKLRRTVVKLNAQLDASERELDAQRTELERAAARMEKDRIRHKQDLQSLKHSHDEDVKTIQQEHASSIKLMTDAHASQVSDLEQRVQRAEEARVREGGDMTMELSDAVEREREALSKVASLEEEKVVLSSRVSSLSAQLTGMESRMESIAAARDGSYERERDAEDKLDQALSVHARQLSQRQAREAELERTVADMAAALVHARQEKEMLLSSSSSRMLQHDPTAANASSSGGANNNNNPILLLQDVQEKLTNAEAEMEMLQAQLMLERQKADTLQQELTEVSKERAREDSAALERQREHDHRVANLTSTIAQLEAATSSSSSLLLQQHPHQDGSTDGTGTSTGTGTDATFMSPREKKLQDEIASLSEDMIRQRGKLQNATSEVQTLRNRLKSAMTRAEYAENAMAMAEASTNNGGGDGGYGYGHGHGYGYDVAEHGGMMRRKYGVRGRKQKATTSIRAALKLDSISSSSSSSSTTEQGSISACTSSIGPMVDTVDRFALGTGRYFKSDPIARAIFLLYLMILHLWAFCLVLFHAHGTLSLEPSADVGPEELLKHSYTYRHLEQMSGPP